jgi:hypothetical protein
MSPDRLRRLAGPLVGAALLAAPSPAVPNGSVEVRPQSEVVAAGDQATIRFRLRNPAAVLVSCAVQSTSCVAESRSSATVTSRVPISTKPGPVTLAWTASVTVDPVEPLGPPQTGTVQLTIVAPRFTVTAEPSEGPPGTAVRVLLQPINPDVQIRECSAGFAATSPVACVPAQNGRSAAVVVPDVRAGPADISWALTYAGGVRDVPLPASGRLTFDVRATVVTETPPPSATATSPPTSPPIGTASAEASPSVIVAAGDADDLPGGLLLLLLLLLLLPLAGVLYAVRRAQARKPGMPTVHSRPGLPRVSADPIYDRPVHSVRVVAHRGHAGPRVDVAPRSPGG